MPHLRLAVIPHLNRKGDREITKGDASMPHLRLAVILHLNRKGDREITTDDKVMLRRPICRFSVIPYLSLDIYKSGQETAGFVGKAP
jgi:hypothetical protein